MTTQDQANDNKLTPGYGKTVGALVGGAVSTLFVGGLAMVGIVLPDAMSNAVQTLITLAAVYYVPHDLGS